MNLERIKFIVFDFDGVFTDNRVIVSQDGTESAICSRSDGFGLSKMRELKIDMMILSTEVVPIALFRASKLKIECVIGCENKLVKLREIFKDRNLSSDDVAFVGNDINDIECLKEVGFPVCVNDAYPEVKEVCKLVLTRNGGYGAVREFCDIIFENKRNELN